MRTIMSVAILGLLGLVPDHAISQESMAALQDATHHDVAGERPAMVFRVQPSVTSVAQALALKGAPSPEDLALKFTIEGNAIALRKKLIICRGC
jgi:hypothetical protein